MIFGPNDSLSAHKFIYWKSTMLFWPFLTFNTNTSRRITFICQPDLPLDQPPDRRAAGSTPHH